ncbi:glucosaminidase domain-containing protein [Dyella jejuensis]|uniref:Glucosaminidase domain-containing protein n=1 Tax=Dyella jejuensis TaxID=1432009 RepID=A0ABW8JHP6_9GAMM
MLRVESSPFGVDQGFDDIALPLGRPADSAGGFSSAFGALQADIRDTIENGFASSSPATLAVGSLPSQLDAGSSAWLATYLADHRSASVERSAGDGATASEAQRLAFLNEIGPWAERAGAQLGTSPHIIAAHAALESNWGLQPVASNGRSVYNLFGIKAGASWSGASVNTMTTEHIDGKQVRLPQRFRAYTNYAGAFNDYASLLKDNPRYAAALNAGNDAHAFSRGLKQGGYATDTAYEEKLVKVARQVERMTRAGG